MIKNPKQSAKLLYIKECFERECSEDGYVTLKDIRAYLAEQGIQISKDATINDAIEAIGVDGYGMQIDHPANSNKYYYRPSQMNLTPSELQLIADCVQASKFLTENDTIELIKKLCKLCSRREENIIRNSVVTVRPTKNQNKDSMGNAKRLREAIEANRQVSFRYGKFNSAMKLVEDGKLRTVSPFALIYSDDNYYLICGKMNEDTHQREIRHYRVDRILGEVQTLSDSREDVFLFGEAEKKYYTQLTFHMYGGKPCDVTMVCSYRILSTVIDQFGYKNMHIQPIDQEHFEITQELIPSQQFFGWVFGLGDLIRITGPQPVVDKFKALTEKVNALYE